MFMFSVSPITLIGSLFEIGSVLHTARGGSSGILENFKEVNLLGLAKVNPMVGIGLGSYLVHLSSITLLITWF